MAEARPKTAEDALKQLQDIGSFWDPIDLGMRQTTQTESPGALRHDEADRAAARSRRAAAARSPAGRAATAAASRARCRIACRWWRERRHADESADAARLDGVLDGHRGATGQ